MCDFKPGDEVVGVGCSPENDPHYEARLLRYGSPHDGVTPGKVYVVATVIVYPRDVGLVLKGVRSRHPTGAYTHHGFRKVERRTDRLSIEAFMTMPGGFEEPRRPKAPAKKRERA